MVKNYVLSGIFLLFSYCSLTAQTGPGGVGQTGASGNIGLWLRADNITNIPNQGALPTWPDASGRGSNAAQNTTANRPTYISSSSFNNRPAVRFDGSNDLMTIASTNILNGNTGFNYDALTYFAVVRFLNNGNPKGILSKRGANNANSTYDFYIQNNLGLVYNVVNNNGNADADNNDASYFNNTNYIVGFDFDGSQDSDTRGALYDGRYNPTFLDVNFAALNNSTAPITIGAISGNANSYANMDVAEVIQFGRSLNEAERIILENYLSSKYNIAINVDRFAYDTPGSNYYGNDVAGIGQADGDEQDDAIGTGILRISNASSLNNNNEFLLWGHNGTSLSIMSSQVPASMFGSGQRLSRVWKLDETGNVGSVTVTFDVSAFPSITSNNSGNLRLLVDTDGDFSNATIIANPTANFSGNNRLVSFSLPDPAQGVSFDNYFITLATTNSSVTPLPVTFISFNAINQAGKVALKWYTASEENNSYFTVERSHNGQDWETVTTVNGAGNSDQALGYTAYDNNPYQGTSYYRIKQTDYNEEFSYSRIATVTVQGANSEVTLSPNPVKDDILRLTFAEGIQVSQVVITNTLGQEVYRKNISQVQELEINTQGYPTGAYFVIISGNNYHKTSKILVER